MSSSPMADHSKNDESDEKEEQKWKKKLGASFAPTACVLEGKQHHVGSFRGC